MRNYNKWNNGLFKKILFWVFGHTFLKSNFIYEGTYFIKTYNETMRSVLGPLT